ncbi:hypothetical protein B0H19DRAFT_1079017 [Mycena capillaripes]|nr:hypothetical protein B0H19DRAFT_1079017 [Mycena capillaripes]
MSLSSPPGAEYTAKQRDVLSQLPTTLEDALKMFKLEPKTRILATCPSCHYTHEPQVNRLTGEPSYPTHCENFIFRDKHSLVVPCLHPLLEQRQAKLWPVKPFVYPAFTDHLASVLSDPEVAALCNSACDEAWKAVHASLSADPHGPVSSEEVNNGFEAEFLRSFNGPVPDQLFINRGGRMRIDIRYKPEYMWLSIILGPHEPDHDQIGYYLRPLIDQFVAGWKPGICLSRTGLSETGCFVDIAIAINVNDLPATRKMLSLAGIGSHHICTVCNCKGVETTHRTDLDDPAWARRDVWELRRWAYTWRDAKTQAECDAIFKDHGVRWSELWRLLYWDPTRMGVVNSMHCILEGLVHYHCGRVLRIDAEVAKKKEINGIVFDQDWSLVVDGDDGDDSDDSEDVEMPVVPQGNHIPAISEETMWSTLHRNKLSALCFVAFSLDLAIDGAKTKANYCDILMAWHRTKGLIGNRESTHDYNSGDDSDPVIPDNASSNFTVPETNHALDFLLKDPAEYLSGNGFTKRRLAPKSVKAACEDYEFVRGKSGVGWDDQQKMATAESEFIDTFVEVHGKKYAKCFNHPCPYYIRLAQLFGGNKATGTHVLHLTKRTKKSTSSSTSASASASVSASTSALASASTSAATPSSPSTPKRKQSALDQPPSPKPYDDELLPAPPKRPRVRNDDNENNDSKKDNINGDKPKKKASARDRDRSISGSSSSGGRRTSRNAEAGNEIARGLKMIGEGMSAPIITKADTSHVDAIIDAFNEDATLLPVDPDGEYYALFLDSLSVNAIRARSFVRTTNRIQRIALLKRVLVEKEMDIPGNWV